MILISMLVQRVISLIECLFNLIYEILMIKFEHIGYLLHKVKNIGKWQSLALNNFLVIRSSQIFQLLKRLFLIIKNEILLFPFSPLTSDI